MAQKWLLVEGVPGKLVPVPGEPGNFYGMQRRAVPDGETVRVMADRYEPMRMIVQWHADAQRAGRKRRVNNGNGAEEVRDLIIHDECRANTRQEAAAMLSAPAPAKLDAHAAEAERKDREAKAKRAAAKAARKAADEAARLAREAEEDAATAQRVAVAVADALAGSAPKPAPVPVAVDMTTGDDA